MSFTPPASGFSKDGPGTALVWDFDGVIASHLKSVKTFSIS